MSTRPISIAIAALGGQGGGVLSDWIVAVAEAQGYLAQATSVPGVAQRTGATVYYLEVFPRAEAEAAGREPVLALYPVPGDVDVVIASELIEAGRAILRGLVTPDLTTLIASSHRVYAIGETTARGDGTVNRDAVIAAGKKAARRFICADLAAAAERTGSIINATLLGALAGSEALPFPREAYEQAIRAGGKAVDANLAGFAAGFDLVQSEAGDSEKAPHESAEPEAPAVSGAAAALRERVAAYPEPARRMVAEGARRCADFQDLGYAAAYLDRLDPILALDRESGGAEHGFRLTTETGRYLALRMCYEDTIRVADLKTRASRFARFREEVRAEPDQIVDVVEYLHPRIEEICDTLPARLGRYILNSPRLSRFLNRVVSRGRKVRTTHLSGFLPLYFLSRLKRFRRGTLRYAIETGRIEGWLDRIGSRAKSSYALAVATAECARLLKGYGETYQRGLDSYERVMTALEALPASEDAARIAAELQTAALADEDGTALSRALERISQPQPAPAGRRAGG